MHPNKGKPYEVIVDFTRQQWGLTKNNLEQTSFKTLEEPINLNEKYLNLILLILLHKPDKNNKIVIAS